MRVKVLHILEVPFKRRGGSWPLPPNLKLPFNPLNLLGDSQKGLVANHLLVKKIFCLHSPGVTAIQLRLQPAVASLPFVWKRTSTLLLLEVIAGGKK